MFKKILMLFIIVIVIIIGFAGATTYFLKNDISNMPKEIKQTSKLNTILKKVF